MSPDDQVRAAAHERIEEEHRHQEVCGACGRSYDKRELIQVLFHAGDHKPMGVSPELAAVPLGVQVVTTPVEPVSRRLREVRRERVGEKTVIHLEGGQRIELLPDLDLRTPGRRGPR